VTDDELTKIESWWTDQFAIGHGLLTLMAIEDMQKLIVEVRRLREERVGEIAEFNAGFNAQRAGVEYDAPGVEQPYDVWRCGWAWGAFDGLNDEVRRLREEQTTRVATQRELDIVLEDNQRLREEIEWAVAVQKAEHERYLFWLNRVKNIRALADARLKLTPSTDEACVLWQIARATEGE